MILIYLMGEKFWEDLVTFKLKPKTHETNFSNEYGSPRYTGFV